MRGRFLFGSVVMKRGLIVEIKWWERKSKLSFGRGIGGESWSGD